MSPVPAGCAAVLGANDGIVSTASLIGGVAAAVTGPTEVLMAGTAGPVAVRSQADTEAADLNHDQAELDGQRVADLSELSAIYVARGVEPESARGAAVQMTARDVLGAHPRDELGMPEITSARPIQAPLTSAAIFSVGAALPLAMVLVPLPEALPWTVSAASLIWLAVLGALLWKSAVSITEIPQPQTLRTRCRRKKYP